MVDRRLIEQLDSVEPDKRKAAIQQLARTKDLDAVRYLEAAERSDSDAGVRDLARKAVAYIKRNTEGQSPQGTATTAKPAPKSKYTPGSIMDEYENKAPEPEEPSEEGAPITASKPALVEVSDARQRNAKSALDMAGRAAFNEENGRATKYLVEAFKQNPNLKFDVYAVGLAATVTGLYKSDAIKAIMDGSALELFDKKELVGKKKLDPSQSATDIDVPPATWGTALVDLVMYGLINAVIVGAFVIILIQVLLAIFQSDPTIQTQLAANQTTLSAVVDLISGYAIVALVLYALIYGLLAIVGLLIQSFLIHVAAHMILGGEGTLPNLIHRTALFLGVMTALIAIVQVGAIFLPIITDPNIGIGIWALSLFLSVFLFMGYSSRIGKAYDIGGNKGCLALFLSSIVTGLLLFACTYVLVQTQFVAFNNLILVTPVP